MVAEGERKGYIVGKSIKIYYMYMFEDIIMKPTIRRKRGVGLDGRDTCSHVLSTTMKSPPITNL
jgi:hypothetical protein